MRVSVLLLLIGCFIFASCGDSIKPGLDKQLSGTDSVKIYFFEKESGSPGKVVTVKEMEEIEKIIASITDEGTEQFKCGYTGQMEFYDNAKVILSPEFNYNEECPHYVFMYKNKMYHKKMSEQGTEIMRNLQK